MSAPRSDAAVFDATPSTSPAMVDLDALLVALVLVPHSYPRNRFFGLYGHPPARRVRRRAALVRSVIADLSNGAADVQLERRARGARLRYRLPDVGARRTTLLSEDELALVKLGVERARATMDETPLAALDGVDPDASSRLAAVLRRLFDETAR
jgi:hypothetical protein